MAQLMLLLILTAAGSWLFIAFLRTDNGWLVLLYLLIGVGCWLAYTLVPPVRATVRGAFHRWSALTRILLLLLVLAFPLFVRTSPYWMFVLTLAGLYVIVAQGLNLQTGTAGLFNLSANALFGTGAYTAALLGIHLGIPGFLNIFLGGLAALAISALLFIPVLKIRGHYLALVTVAFSVVFNIALNNTEAVGGPQGLPKVPGISILGFNLNQGMTIPGIGPIHFYANYYLLVAVLTIAVLFLLQRLYQSPVAMLLNSLRDDVWAARTAGINPGRWRLVTFGFGSALMGMAGAIYASLVGYIAPGNFTFADALYILSIVILGGMDSIAGVTVSAVLLVLMTEKLQVIQEYRFLIYGLVVTLTLIFRPEGLIPSPPRHYFPGLGARSLARFSGGKGQTP